MSPDELRALADALERFSLGTGKIGKAADYLRACADEKPVGVYVHRPAELRYGVEWLVGDPMPNGTQLFTHPAPAAPQAEPKREPLDDDEISRLAWQQNVWTDGMIEFSFLAFARAVERAHGISGGGHD